MSALPVDPEFIVWNDSVSHGAGAWGRLSKYREAMTEAGMRHESVGWVIYEDAVSVAICNSRGTEDADDPNVAEVMQIPVAAIVSRKRLALRPKK